MDRINFAAVAEKEAAAIKERQQKVNKEIARANRRKARGNQRAGGLIFAIPEEIRERALAVLEEIVNDRRKLEACERVLRKRDESELVAAEAAE